MVENKEIEIGIEIKGKDKWKTLIQNTSNV
jgi:hypothetical protein